MSSHDLNPRKRIIVPGRRDNGNPVYSVGMKYAIPEGQEDTPENVHLLCAIFLNGEQVAITDLGTVDEFMAKIGFNKEDRAPSEEG